MLVDSKDAKIKRFIYAASSFIYSDSEALPKVEDVIGKPLSTYPITKYVNELYEDGFGRTYGIETIVLRYFNVFGRRQKLNGAYVVVIPLFFKKFINGEGLVFNGTDDYSGDFTYAEIVIHMNEQAIKTENKLAVNTGL